MLGKIRPEQAFFQPAGEFARPCPIPAIGREEAIDETRINPLDGNTPNPTPASAPAQEPSSWIRERVTEAFADMGIIEGRISPPLLAEDDFASLRSAFAAAPPARILAVGDGMGATTLALALAFPDARIVGIDPDLAAGAGEAPLTVSAAAAARLGVEGRLDLRPGAFAASQTNGAPFASDRERIRTIGPEFCAEQQDFDLILVGGSSATDIRAADLRLAASALSPGGLIATTGVIGPEGATIRAGVSDFLRYNREFHFLHGPIPEARGSLGLLRNRSAGWFPGFEAPRPTPAEGVPDEVREGLAHLVALMLGDRPILEIAVGEPVLGAAFRSMGGTTRKLKLASADWNARFFDPLLDQIISALDHAPGSALFSSDLLDFASDEFVARLFARLADRKTCALLCVTPPGEAGVAGFASRPAARVVDVAASQGLSAYGPAGLEFESARHARPRAAGSTSRYASLLLFDRSGGWRDAAGRPLLEMTPASASQHEQIELQRIHAEAALSLRLAEQRRARSDAERQRDDFRARLETSLAAAEQARRQHETTQGGLRSEIDRLTALNAMLAAGQADAEKSARNERERREAIERDLGARLVAAEAQLRDTRANMERDIAALRAELDAAGLRQAALTSEMAVRKDATDTEIKTLWDEVAALTLARDAARADLATRTAELNSERATLQNLARVRDELAAERDGLLQRAGEAERRVRETGAKAAAADAEVASMRGRLADVSSRLSDISLREGDARSNLNRLIGERDQLVGRNDETARRLADAGRRAEQFQASLAAGAAAHAQETAELKARIADLGARLVAADCRETDARVRLDGIDAHLLLSQQTIDAYRAAPAAFRPDAIAYPGADRLAAKAAGDGPDDVLGLVKSLHGRAADISRDLARELEDASASRAALQLEFGRRLETSRISHEAGLDRARREYAQRLAQVEREASEISTVASRNDVLIARIEDSLPVKRVSVDDAHDDELFDTGARDAAPGAGMAAREATIRGRLSRQQARLAFVLHTIDANNRPAPLPAADIAPAHSNPASSGPASSGPSSPVSVSGAPVGATPVNAASAAAVAAASAAAVAAFSAAKDGKTIAGPLANGSAHGERPIAAAPNIPGAPAAPRPVWRRAWDFVRTYRETARLIDLQRDISQDLAPLGLRPRAFDAGHYLSRYDIAPYSDPLRHYLLVGEKAGNWPLVNFDPAYYAVRAGDLSGWSGSLLAHFLAEGVHRGASPSADLDPLGPLAASVGLARIEYFFQMEKASRDERLGTKNGAASAASPRAVAQRGDDPETDFGSD